MDVIVEFALVVFSLILIFSGCTVYGYKRRVKKYKRDLKGNLYC